MYAKWIQSWRDLPVLINQWANIVRWEKVTRLFLRTTEFLWQEGHTAHETAEEAEEETLRILGLYKEFVETELAMPVIAGRKSESEKFAGAARTYSIEALMGDGRALQAGTSHNLGQNFAKAFEITFQARDKSLQHIWGTSWGVTTRLIGGVVMTHGDESGLVLPPRVAPYQVVIVPIPRGNWQETVLPRARAIEAELAALGVRVKLDDRDAYTPGWKFAEWELRGVPLRLEIGPKDIEKAQVMLVRRDTREKRPTPMAGLGAAVQQVLADIQQNLFDRAVRFREEHTSRVTILRRVQAGHGRTPRFRHRAVVRLGRLRGADQDGHAGHDPQPPARGLERAACACDAASRESPRRISRRRTSRDQGSGIRDQESGLAGANGGGRRGGPSRRCGRLGPLRAHVLDDSVPLGQPFAVHDLLERAGQVRAPPVVAGRRRRRPRERGCHGVKARAVAGQRKSRHEVRRQRRVGALDRLAQIVERHRRAALGQHPVQPALAPDAIPAAFARIGRTVLAVPDGLEHPVQ